MKNFTLSCLAIICGLTAQAQWSTSGTNIYNSNSGNVGIGTTSPSAGLEIFESSTNNLALQLNSSGPGWGSGARFKNTSASGKTYGIYSGQDGIFHFADVDNGVDRLAFATNGNVGIGTTTPSTKLHVNGALRIESAAGGVVGTGTGSRIELSTGGTTSIEENWGINLIGSDASPVKVRNAALLVGYTSSSAGWGTGGNLLVQGNVGIGTTTPSQKVHISGTGEVISRIEATDDGYASLELKSGSKVWQWSKRTSASSNMLQLYFYDGAAWSAPAISFTTAGNVGIGTSTPGSYKLAVEGKIGAREVNVIATNPWPDYVFEKNYKLRSLEEIKNYIDQNQHLPEVPSAKEVEKNGVNLGEMNALLLKKIEELTLYMIELKKENESARAQMQTMQTEINRLKK